MGGRGLGTTTLITDRAARRGRHGSAREKVAAFVTRRGCIAFRGVNIKRVCVLATEGCDWRRLPASHMEQLEEAGRSAGDNGYGFTAVSGRRLHRFQRGVNRKRRGFMSLCKPVETLRTDGMAAGRRACAAGRRRNATGDGCRRLIWSSWRRRGGARRYNAYDEARGSSRSWSSAASKFDRSALSRE